MNTSDPHPNEERLLQELATLQTATLRPPAQRVIEHRLRQKATALYHQRNPKRISWTLALRWSSTLTAAVLLWVVSLWTVRIAQATVPGELLYPLKRVVEKAELAFIPPSQLAAFHANLGQERTRELMALIGHQEENATLLEAVALDISASTEIALANSYAIPPAEREQVLRQILAYVEAQQDLVTSIKALAPLAADGALAQTLVELSDHQKTVEDQLALLTPDDNGLPLELWQRQG